MDGLVRLSAAGFYNDYKDYQTFTLTNASGIISNNDAHAWGVETNANFTFSSAFQGSLALSYTKATVENVAVAAATATAPAVIRDVRPAFAPRFQASGNLRSEEHTSELQSLMRISYAVFCLKKKKQNTQEAPTQLYKHK